jgi:hypothetical protein
MALLLRVAPPLALAAGLAFGAGALAGDGEKEGGRETAPDHEAGAAHSQKKALAEIVDLMRKAEERLAESETGAATQGDERRIARALAGEGAALDRLAKLVKEIEDCPE